MELVHCSPTILNGKWHAAKEKAEARLDGGKTAEVVLKIRRHDIRAVVMKNLKYGECGATTVFVMMPNEVEAYRAGENHSEFKGIQRLHDHARYQLRDVAAADCENENRYRRICATDCVVELRTFAA